MNPKGKLHITTLALLTAVSVGLIILATASLSNQIPEQILPVNSSTELNLSAYFPEFQENVWFSVSRTKNISVVIGKSLAEPWKFYRNPSVTIVPFRDWTGEELIEFKATDGEKTLKKSVLVRVVPSTMTTTIPDLITTTTMLIEKASVLITESISSVVSQPSGRRIGISAPTQTNTSWSDNFSDSTGISTISNLNFSAGNLL